MTNRFADAKIPLTGPDGEPETELKQLWESTQAEVTDLWTKFQFNTALERTMTFVTATNAYIEKRAPWKLGKSTEDADQVLLRTALATMAESLRLAATLLQPVTPGVTEKIHGVLGYTPGEVWSDELAWDGRLADRPVDKGLVLFPRIQAADKNSA
jgi:methionyl-tRNA synthetase